MRTRNLLAVVIMLTAASAASAGSAWSASPRASVARYHSARWLCAHHRARRPCGSLLDWRLPAHPRLLSNSAAMVERIVSNGDGQVAPVQLNPAPRQDWGVAVFHSKLSDPLYRIHCNKPDAGTCPLEGWRIHIPPRARPADGGDAGMSVINAAHGMEYDFWNVQSVPLPPHGGTIVVGWGGWSRLNAWGEGTEHACGAAACMSMTKGVITYHDLSSGHINHALFLVVNCSNGQAVYPAWTGNAGGGECNDPTNAPAWGQWFQLAMSDREINRLAVPGWLKAVYKAFAHYGAVAYDAGSNHAFDIQIESPQSYTALDIRNPFIGWAAWRSRQPRSHVEAYTADGRRYALDFNGINWRKRLRVIAPCVIAGSC